MSSCKPRISDVDIEETQMSVPFNGKTHKMTITGTCYGDYLGNPTQVLMLAGIEDEKAAYDHFNKLSKRIVALQHGGIKLKEHLQNLDQLAYKHVNSIVTTYEGIEMTLQESKNPNVIKNKKEVLAAFHAGYAQLCASKNVDTSKPYQGSKKQCTENNNGGSGASEVACRERYDVAHFVPLDDFKAYTVMDLDHIQKVNVEALKLKDAILERERIEREAKKEDECAKMERERVDREAKKEDERVERQEKLVFDNALVKNEKQRVQIECDRQMLSDADYRAHLKEKLIRESNAAIENAAREKAAEERKETEAIEKAARETLAAEAKRQMLMERSRKAKETRRKKMRESKLKAYAAGNALTRLCMMPEIDAFLSETLPEKKQREDFLAALVDAAEPKRSQKAGIYVLKLQGLGWKYYVGSAKNVEKRLAAHQKGVGAACTKGASSIVRMPLLTKSYAEEDLDGWERRETLAQMLKHGIDAVRGWHFVAPTDKMPDALRKEAIKNICSARNLCCKCGNAGHFNGDCNAVEYAQWMQPSHQEIK